MPLLISRKPRRSDFTLPSGGNTRLEICRQLFHEGDSRFEKIPCIVQPWVSDIYAVIAHLRETEMHGALLFIDKAQAIMSIRNFNVGKGEKPTLSQRELIDVLSQNGYPLSQGMISYMDYAVNRLYPHMPIAFHHGLGKQRIVKIKNLERTAKELWSRQTDEQQEAFDEIFGELCTRHDSPDWDFDAFEEAVTYELSMAFDLEQSVTKIMCAEEQSGRSFRLDPAEATPPAKEEPLNPSKPIDQDSKVEFELKRLRKKAFKHAKSLALNAEIEDLVLGTGDSLFGYIVADLPKKNASKFERALWACLIAYCEQTKASKRTLRALLPPTSCLLESMGSQRVKDLILEFANCPLSESGEQFMSQLDDQGWNAFMNLVSCYRSIRKLAQHLGLKLWKDL